MLGPGGYPPSHLQEVERLKEEHGVAVSELKATSLASQTRGRQDLKAETERQLRSLTDAHSSHISETESKHSLALSDTEARFKNERSELIGSHSRELESLVAGHRFSLADAGDQKA